MLNLGVHIFTVRVFLTRVIFLREKLLGLLGLVNLNKGFLGLFHIMGGSPRVVEHDGHIY